MNYNTTIFIIKILCIGIFWNFYFNKNVFAENNCSKPTIQDLENKFIRHQYKIPSKQEQTNQMVETNMQFAMPTPFTDPSKTKNISPLVMYLQDQIMPTDPNELIGIEIYQKFDFPKTGDFIYTKMINTSHPEAPPYVLTKLEVINIEENKESKSTLIELKIKELIYKK